MIKIRTNRKHVFNKDYRDIYGDTTYKLIYIFGYNLVQYEEKFSYFGSCIQKSYIYTHRIIHLTMY